MGFQPKPTELQTLVWLAEYRVLTGRQIEVLAGVNSRTVQRRMKSLTGAGLVNAVERPFSEGRGRPGRLYSLSQKGADFLKSEGVLEASISFDKIRWDSARSLEHQIGVNWVLIHATLLEHFSALKVRSLSPTSPSQPDGENGIPIVHEKVTCADHTSQCIDFTPDAVIAITHPDQNKSLLFFLEADRSTESLSGGRGSLRQKLLNYQAYFRSRGYERYGNIFERTFNGFRLLFVCDSRQRVAKLCHLVRDAIPSDFVWITAEEDILTHGLGAKIWARGGSDADAPQSILGPRLAFDTQFEPSRSYPPHSQTPGCGKKCR